MSGRRFDELVTASLAHGPDRVAVVAAGREHSYHELLSAAERLEGVLRGAGAAPGGHVVVGLPASFAAVAAVLAAGRAGSATGVLDPLTPRPRLDRVLHIVRPDVLIAAPGDEDRWSAALATAGCDGTRLVVVDAAATVLAAPPAPSPAEDAPSGPPGAGDEGWDGWSADPGLLLFTSGSTGAPKCVVLSHANVAAAVRAVAGYLEHTPDDVVVSVIPISLGYGLLQVLVPLSSGGRVVLERGFAFPADTVASLVAHRATGFAAVPTIFATLVANGALAGADLSALRYVTNAAAPLPQRLVSEVRAAFAPARLYLMYGLSECLRASFLPPAELDARPRSIGRGMPGVTLTLRGGDGALVPPGEVGELYVTGPNVMLGYLGDPVATAAMISPGARPGERELRTGDLFVADADGFLTFAGRVDDVLKSRGLKVSPVEVEEVIFDFPEVAEARVVGVPDDLLGHALRAEIVVHPGLHLDERTVRRVLRASLEPHKVPTEIVFVEALPKSIGGKVLRTTGA